jgi:hypothetical protein
MGATLDNEPYLLFCYCVHLRMRDEMGLLHIACGLGLQGVERILLILISHRSVRVLGRKIGVEMSIIGWRCRGSVRRCGGGCGCDKWILDQSKIELFGSTGRESW